MRLETGLGSESILCGARHVGSEETVRGRIWVSWPSVEEGRASLPWVVKVLGGLCDQVDSGLEEKQHNSNAGWRLINPLPVLLLIRLSIVQRQKR